MMKHDKNVKSKGWVLEVDAVRLMKVVFDEELTLHEAVESFMADDYGDVIDEDSLSNKVVGGEPM